jgi:hypothetical protein
MQMIPQTFNKDEKRRRLHREKKIKNARDHLLPHLLKCFLDFLLMPK